MLKNHTCRSETLHTRTFSRWRTAWFLMPRENFVNNNKCDEFGNENYFFDILWDLFRGFLGYSNCVGFHRFFIKPFKIFQMNGGEVNPTSIFKSLKLLLVRFDTNEIVRKFENHPKLINFARMLIEHTNRDLPVFKNVIWALKDMSWLILAFMCRSFEKKKGFVYSKNAVNKELE